MTRAIVDARHRRGRLGAAPATAQVALRQAVRPLGGAGARRVLVPDETALEIPKHCDGENSVDAIVGALAEAYAAPAVEIREDVSALLQDLTDKGFIQL